MSRLASLHQTTPHNQWNAPLRFVTATALYDGHDAAINVIRRLFLEQGGEVIHLGHNRSVAEIVRAAIQEDADAIAVSSYQGGHMEFFRYLLDELKRHHAETIQLFVGGGGTITQQEARELEAAGVCRVYTTEDGLSMGLQGMVQDVIDRTRAQLHYRTATAHPPIEDQRAIAQTISAIEQQHLSGDLKPQHPDTTATNCPVIGITGTGGAGKSSLIDELLGLMFEQLPDIHIACLTMDPTRHRTGGAMLGDRIRINNTVNPNLFLHSLATRRRHLATSVHLAHCISYLRGLGFDLLLVETAGTGQSDSEIIDLVDIPIYVMTSDFGAPSQLEKIEMLAYADLVALNKADRLGAKDALSEVRKQWRIEHETTQLPDTETPVIATQANHFADPGIRDLFQQLCDKIAQLDHRYAEQWRLDLTPPQPTSGSTTIIPVERRQYLAEIAIQGQVMDTHIEDQAELAIRAQACFRSLGSLNDPLLPEPLSPYDSYSNDDADPSLQQLRQNYMQALKGLSKESLSLLRNWPQQQQQYLDAEYRYQIRGQEYVGDNYITTLSETELPKIALPRTRDWGELLRFLLKENLPGKFPFTAGVFPYRRTSEDPARMFAGAGSAENTNHRFHFLARGQRAIRLSTAFDPITLYGEDPAASPDIHGRIGMSGVSVATLDDFKRLYSGFDLCQPNTSVSMTINGPGAIALACFINTAIDQQVEKWLHSSGNRDSAEKQIQQLYRDASRPVYRSELPDGHSGLGLGLLGVSGADLVDAGTYAKIKEETLTQLRGTLQADILKEDQAQNECLFPIEFALRLMGDVQGFISSNAMHNYYSVSVSGYHIAEAGANPVTQLAFTLANGFTLVEYFLARGMHVDQFAPHLSFFFSNGMDAEYAVIGRVARRIWSLAMRDYYGASPRSQRLKYHIQTSGRSLHTREIGLNDIRTTLQALNAINDNCNSLHTNAADEAVTTPTEETVRRALAIQLIINREYGLSANENNLQGSFIIDELTDLVEAAVYVEFERISERGGVLAAMESRYQRRRIQEQSLLYEQRRNDGTLPIIGVNTFTTYDNTRIAQCDAPLIRSSQQERDAQVRDVAAFKALHADAAVDALSSLQECAVSKGNIFCELLDTVRVASLGQITQALYKVAGHYRRCM